MADIYRASIARVELDGDLVREHVGSLLATGDKQANRFGVEVYRDGKAVSIAGMALVGYFIRPEADTVVINGTVSGNTGYVELPQSCYTQEGAFTLAIKLSGGNVVQTVRIMDGRIALTQDGDLIDPGEVVPTLDDILGKIAACEAAGSAANTAAAAANEATQSIRADHYLKIPIVIGSDVDAKNGSSISTTARVDASGQTIGVEARYNIIRPCSYILSGVHLGDDYNAMVAEHPRVRIWLYARQDMRVNITFANSKNGWGSTDGTVAPYGDEQVALKANEMAWVDFDYTQDDVREFYENTQHWQSVGVIVSLIGRVDTGMHDGVYDIDWFATDAFERDFAADHATHADTADHATHADNADHATHADNADHATHADTADHATHADTAATAWNAVAGELAVFHAIEGGMDLEASGNVPGGYRIKYGVGENGYRVNIISTYSIGKVAELRGKKFLVKCINRNQDTATDNAVGWMLSHTSVYNQQWGQDKGSFGVLRWLANGGTRVLSIDYDACVYDDDDDVYLRITNKNNYAVQTQYSLDIDIIVYIVAEDYANNSGVVVATMLDGFDPDEYVRKDNAAELFGAGYITCWGDSLTAMGGWTTTLQTLSGMAVYNGGTGGENVRTIAARQGADVMVLNGITIPADTTPVTLATYAQGIPTELGYKATPLLQGGAHVNPVMIGGIEGTLRWTGSTYNDATGTWTFARSTAGEKVALNRPTAMRTDFDRNRNAPHLMVIYMGQNGGYDDLDDLVRMHRLMIAHSHAKNVVVLGLSSGSEAQRAGYETRMRKEFGRYFVSLREYLAHPIYDEDGDTIVSCYGLDDAGLTATEDDLVAIATGTVPPQLLADSVHYTTTTRTVIGKMLYKRCCELGIFEEAET